MQHRQRLTLSVRGAAGWLPIPTPGKLSLTEARAEREARRGGESPVLVGSVRVLPLIGCVTGSERLTALSLSSSAAKWRVGITSQFLLTVPWIARRSNQSIL